MSTPVGHARESGDLWQFRARQLRRADVTILTAHLPVAAITTFNGELIACRTDIESERGRAVRTSAGTPGYLTITLMGVTITLMGVTITLMGVIITLMGVI